MALNSFNGNLLVEDSSPLISYEPAGSWTDSPNDPALATYSGNSYHITSSQGATATFTFVGTGVSILGGHRPNYGTYTVSVDGQNPTSSTSQANQASTGQTLFSMAGLSYGSHTVVLTNTGGAPVDIDAIEFQTTGGTSGSSPMVPKDFDDTDPAMTYQPSSTAWTARQDPRFSGDTLHFTNTPGASASMKFSGQAVAVYGTVSPDHADIVVNLDGQQGVSLPGGAGGFASQVHPNVLLFYRSDLDASEHTITMSGDAHAGTGPFIDLDRITVFSASGGSASAPVSSVASAPASTSASTLLTALASASPTTSATAVAEITTTPSSSNTQNLSANGSGSHKPTGIIIGAVLGGLGLIFVLVATAILLCLRRRRQRTKRLHKSMISVSPVLPMQDKPITPILPMQRASSSSPTNARNRDVEQDGMNESGGGNNNLRVENPAFPFPAAFPLTPKRSLASLSSRYPASVVRSDTVSSHSRGPSELSNGSNGSAAPLVQNVPVIRVNAPQPRRPSIARKPAPGMGPAPTGPPMRPTNRPPTMDFTEVPR